MSQHDTSPGSGGGEGELFGDLWILYRDLDPSDGGGNGEPVLDDNGQVIPIGHDPATGEIFPIYLVEAEEGKYEVPVDLEPFLQEIVLERGNMIRAPESVTQHALEEALATLENGTSITTDPAGRIVVDGVTIDSPRQNFALYQLIMSAGGSDSWTDVKANAAANLPAPLASLIASGWDPTGLLAGGFSKFVPISLDAVITAHTLLNVNEVTDLGDTLQIDHFGFTTGSAETFDYDRVARYGDKWIQWYQDLDGDPSDLERVERRLLDVVWGSDGNGDGVNDVGSGTGWTDTYVKLSADGQSFETADASKAGVNDWAQAVEDARAVIFTMHEFVAATEIAPPPETDDEIVGSLCADLLAGWGGNDIISGLRGDDTLEGGDGNDVLRGGLDDDSLEGGAGNDRADGGAGNDSVSGFSGNDRLFGSLGDDQLWGGGGRDLIDGGDGNDTLRGNVGNDLMRGGAGDDVLTAGDGNDTVEGGTGDDRISGAEGADTIVFRVGDGFDRVVDFADGDVIALGGITVADALAGAVETGGNVVLDFGAGDGMVLVGLTLASLGADDFTVI